METPLLEINLKKVKENYENFKKFFNNVFYAIKANYNPRILEFLSNSGCGVEICSYKEFKIARKFNFKRIVYNGFKSKEEIEDAINDVFLINVESIREYNIVNELGKNVLIGARMKLKDKSKLGIEPEEIKNLKFDCIAFNTGTQASKKEFLNNLEKAIKISDFVGAKYIDIGGGFGEDFDEEFAKEILERSRGKEIIVEPGRGLVGNCGTLYARVIEIKGEFIICNTGLNFLSKFSRAKIEIDVLGKEGKKKNKNYIVCGLIPSDVDCFGRFNLPNVEIGDILKISNVGAYTTSLSSEFVTELPKIKIIEV